MALVNTTRKFIYLFEPNTRSTLVEDALKVLPGSSVIAGLRYKKLQTLVENRDVTQEQADTYRIVCTVRNPYDSFIARYLKAYPTTTVENFLTDKSLSVRMPLVMQPANGMYEEATDFVWFEYLSQDIRSLFGITIANPKLTHRSGGKEVLWGSYYLNKPFRFVLKPSAATLRYRQRFGYVISRDDTTLSSYISTDIRDSFVQNRKPI